MTVNYLSTNDRNILIVQSLHRNILRRIIDTLPLSLLSTLNSSFYQNYMPLLLHIIQCWIQVWPRYFINQVRPARPGQNMTWLTRMTVPIFNPGIVYSYISLWLHCTQTLPIAWSTHTCLAEWINRCHYLNKAMYTYSKIV